MVKLLQTILFVAMLISGTTLTANAQGENPYEINTHHRYGTIALVAGHEDGWAKHTGISGKITDETGMAIENVTLTILNGSHFFDAVMMEDGTYYTDSLMPGDYDISINANGVVYKSKMSLKQGDNSQRGYNFQITKTGVKLTESDLNPFSEKTLKRIRKEPAKIDY